MNTNYYLDISLSLYLQVIYDPVEHSAAAILLLNAVVSQQFTEDLIQRLGSAPSVCGQLPWVTWDTTDLRAGYTFCWRAENLAAVLPYAPEVDTFRLLVN